MAKICPMACHFVDAWRLPILVRDPTGDLIHWCCLKCIYDQVSEGVVTCQVRRGPAFPGEDKYPDGIPDELVNFDDGTRWARATPAPKGKIERMFKRLNSSISHVPASRSGRSGGPRIAASRRD
jgi:hypothetical protein